MRTSTEPSNIEYGVLTALDAVDMTRMLAETFCRTDPLAVAAGLATRDFEQFVQLLCPKAVDQGLTVVAREKATGELVGALLGEDSASLHRKAWTS